MANIYISYFEKPVIMGDVVQNPGEFLSSTVITPAGSSATTSAVIPAGTQVIQIWGDAAFYSIIGTTAAKDATSSPFPANLPKYYTTGFNPGVDKISAIDI